MNIRKMSVAVAVLLGLNGSCFASAPMAQQSVIHFQGAIVEAACKTSGTAQGLALNGCPALAHGNSVSVRRVEPEASISSLEPSAPHVKLLLEQSEGQGRFAQHYVLLDAANKPVSSGNYLMTLTYP